MQSTAVNLKSYETAEDMNSLNNFGRKGFRRKSIVMDDDLNFTLTGFTYREAVTTQMFANDSAFSEIRWREKKFPTIAGVGC